MTVTDPTASFTAQRVRRLGVTEHARDIRVVHDLDGILGQVTPESLITTGDALWDRWVHDSAFATPDVLLGLDAGGILPTVAVALASGTPYRLAWKLDLDLPHKARFSEPHARRTDVYTYGDLRGQRVLIVDDEITTGRTLANLVAVLRTGGADVTGIACLIEDTSGEARAVMEDLGVPLCTLTRI
ncbi:phosphoribosyltransferase [Promicromonospora sp. MS192]|uniref:phosphoribosyltransferase n=1 Tax=Promicromonospora sp. MS192 TaxID=3412684 RepID=UPI003C2F335B